MGGMTFEAELDCRHGQRPVQCPDRLWEPPSLFLSSEYRGLLPGVLPVSLEGRRSDWSERHHSFHCARQTVLAVCNLRVGKTATEKTTKATEG
jgi:hypothetical protein